MRYFKRTLSLYLTLVKLLLTACQEKPESNGKSAAAFVNKIAFLIKQTWTYSARSVLA